ncbi:MAG: hypothetical protein NC405_09220 [Odoribacter sp.]|nr:hypothetical protein [Odoribacter sp.]
MHKLLLLLTILLPAAAMAAEKSDTIINISNPDSVRILSGDGGWTRILINGKTVDGTPYSQSYSMKTTPIDTAEAWDIELPFSKSSSSNGQNRRRWQVFSFDDIYIGATCPSGDDKKLNGGWEIGIMNIMGVRFRPMGYGTSLSLGAGIGYRSLNGASGLHLEENNGSVYVLPNPAGTDASSRLHIFRLQIPLLITQPLFKELKLKAGVVYNMNFSLRATTKYRTPDTTRKESLKGLHQQFSTFDIYAALGWSDWGGIYFTYSPSYVFMSGYGPDTKVISFGLTLSF